MELCRTVPEADGCIADGLLYAWAIGHVSMWLHGARWLRVSNAYGSYRVDAWAIAEVEVLTTHAARGTEELGG